MNLYLTISKLAKHSRICCHSHPFSQWGGTQWLWRSWTSAAATNLESSHKCTETCHSVAHRSANHTAPISATSMLWNTPGTGPAPMGRPVDAFNTAQAAKPKWGSSCLQKAPSVNTCWGPDPGADWKAASYQESVCKLCLSPSMWGLRDGKRWERKARGQVGRPTGQEAGRNWSYPGQVSQWTWWSANPQWTQSLVFVRSNLDWLEASKKEPACKAWSLANSKGLKVRLFNEEREKSNPCKSFIVFLCPTFLAVCCNQASLRHMSNKRESADPTQIATPSWSIKKGASTRQPKLLRTWTKVE